MTDADTGLALRHQGWLPLRWSAVDAQALQAQSASLQARAEQVLRQVIGLEEVMPAPLRDDDAPCQAELSAIQFRLDLLLDLVGQLLTQGQERPAPCQLALDALGVGWQAAESGPWPTPGDSGLLSLYLHPGFPNPLILAAQGTVPEPGELARVRWQALGDGPQDLLERWIFLHHRRDIAGRRGRG